MKLYSSKKRVITCCCYTKTKSTCITLYILTQPVCHLSFIRKAEYMFDTVYFLFICNYAFRLHIHYPFWI